MPKKIDLTKLRLKVELRELALLASTRGANFIGADDDPRYVLQLLEWASTQTDSEVLEHLKRIENYLSPVHKRFFASNGIRFSSNQETTSGGINNHGVDAQAQTNPKTETEETNQAHKDKKKIIYRGQETWV